MAKKRKMRIAFPLGGLDRKRAFRQQAPFSTANCMNVRPVGTMENRERGGSRPGLINAFQDSLPAEVRFLHPMILAPGDDFTAWSDTFGGSGLAAAWTQASWATDVPSILQAMASVDTSVADAAIVRDALTIDTTETYTVEMFIVPWDGTFHGEYQLYLRMDDTTPAYATEGVEIELISTNAAGTYTGTLKSYLAGVETSYALTPGELGSRPGWLIAEVTGDTIKVYWLGELILTQAVSAHTGTRVGFGLECTEAGGLNLCNVFRVQYYSTGTVDALRTMIVTSSNGRIYRETPYGQLQIVGDVTYPTVRSDVLLDTAQSGQKLYIADFEFRVTGTDGVVVGTLLDDDGNDLDWSSYGIDSRNDVVVISNGTGAVTNGTYKIAAGGVAAAGLTLASAPGNGTCTFRVERAPKVYDPIENTIEILTATAGAGGTPSGCPLICRHGDRIYLGGAEIAPHAWYAARQGTETDWDYSQTDSQRAVSGPVSAAGIPGTGLTAFAPHSDDYLIMGCRHELYRLRGDPAYGGTLDALSHTVGIVDKHAWCFGPAGEMIFLSLDGIYILPPGGDSKPISMSREVLPQELLNFDPNTTTVLLEYDVNGRGVHIFLTPDSSNDRIHWWFDWERKTFWPLTLHSNNEPTATCALQAIAIEDSGVILGGRNGTLRRFSDLAESDCGASYATYVDIGPIPLAPDGSVGTLMSLDAGMAEDGGDVTWGVYSALTFEATASADVQGTGTWVAGINATVYPGGRGQAYMLRITGSASRRWGFEQIVTTVMDSGRRRIA